VIQNAYHPLAIACTSDTGHTGHLVRAGRRVDHGRPTRAACLRAQQGFDVSVHCLYHRHGDLRKAQRLAATKTEFVAFRRVA